MKVGRGQITVIPTCERPNAHRLFVRALILAIGLLAVNTPHAWAFTEQSVVAIPGLYYQNGPLLKAPDGAVPWQTFAATKEIQKTIRHPDRLPDVNLQPQYGAQIQKLSGKTIKLYGYMFPLDTSDDQKHFLIGPYPQICQFHFHIRPSLVVEVTTKTPVPFSYDPVMVTGILRLAEPNSNGSFYFLDNAAPAK